MDFLPAFDLGADHTATLELPRFEDGCELVMIGRESSLKNSSTVHPPDVKIAVNGRELGNFKTNFPHCFNGCSVHGARFVISGAMLNLATNTVTFAVRDFDFLGRMVISRHPALARVTRLALPLFAWMFLASLAWWFAGSNRRWIFPVALVVTFFAGYHQSLATMKIAPFADYFFSDPADFIKPIALGEYTFDVAKHPLFQPVARPLYLLLKMLFSQPGAEPMAVMFSLVGAFNVFLAWRIFRRWFARPLAAAMLAVLYGFTFSVWTFSSHIETYIFSATAANLFLLAMLGRDRLKKWAGIALQVAAGSFAALMNPPLLVLNAVSLVRMRRCSGKFAVLRESLIAAAVLVIYMAGTRIIGHFSGAMNDSDSAPKAVGGLVGSEAATFHHYARSANLTLFQAGNILAGQCVHAIAGQTFPSHWSDGLRGIEHLWKHECLGAPAALAVAALWAAGLAGLALQRERRRTSLELFALVLLPYFLFFWAFNPGEMFLYSAPLVSLLLAWLGRGWEKIFAGARLEFFLLACGFFLLLHNAACLASYP